MSYRGGQPPRRLAHPRRPTRVVRRLLFGNTPHPLLQDLLKPTVAVGTAAPELNRKRAFRGRPRRDGPVRRRLDFSLNGHEPVRRRLNFSQKEE